MSIQVFQHVKDAIHNLDPEEIRKQTDQPLRVLLHADNEQEYRQLESYLIPEDLSAARRAQVRRLFYRASEGAAPAKAASGDLEIYFDPSHLVSKKSGVFAFDPYNPEAIVDQILDQRPNLAVPLALNLLPFRREVSERMVKKVAKENALFALATAVPDIVPFLALPWTLGEFASDTAFLTANQVRMAFLLAAANDREVSYRHQRGEIASIIAGAFGWRAIARELVGKIPFGGGLIPKAAIAYAGTRVVGMSLERYYRLGRAYTRAERRLAYEDALERGKHLVGALIEGFQDRGSRGNRRSA